MGSPFTLGWFSERHLVARVADASARGLVHAARRRLRDASCPFLAEVVPGADSLLIALDLSAALPAEAFARIDALLAELTTDDDRSSAPSASSARSDRTVVVPVCFDAEFAPDLVEAAARAGMTEEAFRDAFTRSVFRVAFLGFMPGFAYLEGLPAALHLPRLASPRAAVPAGSVAIGGTTAGIYPFASPGGWRLIGRTPLVMFDGARESPSLLLSGDAVRFESVTRAAFDRLRESSRRPA